MKRVLSLVLAATALIAPAAAVAKEPVFVPVYEKNFPDPFVLSLKDGSFIAYATNDGINLPIITSRDLVNWSPVMDPAAPTKRLDGMPTLAPWVKEGFTWAPEVMQVGGKYILYYTANHRQQDKQCLGAAVADKPTGPFVDTSAQPLVCQFELGGSIDANPFRDKDGKLYLYWKADGNRIGKPSSLWGQEMRADGLAVVGQPVDLGLGDKEEWKQRVIEAPTMIRTPDGLAMLYSGGYFGWNPDQRLSPYAMGWALCSGPLGPCTDKSAKPILYSYSAPGKEGCLSGPGHQSIFRAKGGTFISFHGWESTRGCRKAKEERELYIAPFGWENGGPVIAPSLRRNGSGERG